MTVSVLCCSLFLRIHLSSVRNQEVFQGLPGEVWTFVLPLLLDFILFFTHPLQFNSIKMPCCSHAHSGVPNTHTKQRYLTPLHSSMEKCFETQRMGRKSNTGGKAFSPMTWRNTLAVEDSYSSLARRRRSCHLSRGPHLW